MRQRRAPINDARDRRRMPWLLMSGYVALAVLIAAASFRVWNQQARSLRAEAEHSLAAIGDLKAGQISVWMQGLRGDAGLMRNDLLLSAAVTDMLARHNDAKVANATARVQALLDAFQQQDAYAAVELTSTSGAPLVRAPETASEALRGEIAALVARAVSKDRVAVSDLYLDAAGRTRLDLVAPISGREGSGPAIAAVILHVNPGRFLDPLFQEWPLPSKSGETLLVERRGERVVYLSELRFRSDTALRLTFPLASAKLPAAMAVRGERGVVQGVDYQGVPVLAALQPVPNTPWFVVAKVDSDEALGSIGMRGWATAGFAVLLIAVAGMGSLLLWWAREARTTAALNVSGERFRTLFENMIEGVALHALVVDADGAAVDYRVLDVNPAFAAQCGVAAEQACGKLSREAYGTDTPPFLAEYAQAAQSGEPSRFESFFEPLHRYFDITVVPQDAGRFATVFEDITERKRDEQKIKGFTAELERRVQERTLQLDAVNKELEAFSYSVSHDLRAPLRHISGFSDLLVAHAADELDAKGRHYVETISASAREMGVLIADLLEFSRSGRMEVRSEEVDMMQALNDAAEPLRSEASDREIEWSIGVLPHVDGDHALLRQVWANLLSNAIKFTRGRTPARIEIGVIDGDDDHSETVFFVRDNGVGFDMQYADKLFGAFQRLHAASEFEGTGIGLANVRRYIGRLGGRVWAEAELDRGATFYFSLPRRKESAS